MGKQKLRHVARLFGERIAAKRKEKGITQEALAEKLGISQESLCRMEKGLISPRFERLLDFSQALDCPIADLFAKPIKGTNVLTTMCSSGPDAAHVRVSVQEEKPNTFATRMQSFRSRAAHVPRSAPVKKSNTVAAQLQSLRSHAAHVPRSARIKKPNTVETSYSSNPESAFVPVDFVVDDSPYIRSLASMLSSLPADKQKEIVEIVQRIISATKR